MSLGGNGAHGAGRYLQWALRTQSRRGHAVTIAPAVAAGRTTMLSGYSARGPARSHRPSRDSSASSRPRARPKRKGIRNLVWVLAPWVFVAITFKEWILVLDG